MPKKDTLDGNDLAAMYGWAMAVLKSNKSLYAVFQKAVKNTWTPERFQAEVRKTSWFKSNSDAMRSYVVLKNTDPRTMRARRDSTRTAIGDMAAQLGAQISQKVRDRIAENVLIFGWSDGQIRDILAQAVKPGAAGYGGQAATDVKHLKATALNNGVKLGDATIQGWAQRLAGGEQIEGFDNYIRKTAKAAFPGWEKEIDAGVSVRELADPYIQQMSATLELSPDSINLFDPTIRKALQDTDPATGKFAAKPLWQFETDLKHDARFDQTKQGRAASADLRGAFSQMFTGA